YGTSFGTEPPEAYERLLLDCMLGDATLFIRGDETEASWRWITNIHQAWAAEGPREIPAYDAGTWGPPEAEQLLARDGHAWRRPRATPGKRSRASPAARRSGSTCRRSSASWPRCGGRPASASTRSCARVCGTSSSAPTATRCSRGPRRSSTPSRP